MLGKMLKLLVVTGLFAVVVGASSCADDETQTTPTREADTSPQQAEEEDSPERLRVFEEFGRPASAPQTAAVAAVVRRYLAAIATKDWEQACAFLSKGSRGAQTLPECAKSLSASLKPLRDAYGVALGQADVTRVRVQRGYAAAFYAVPDRLEQVLALRYERGAWRAGTNLPL